MQKAPAASVSSGQVAPTIVGQDKDSKEIYILSGLVLFLAVVVAGFWYYSQSDEIAQSNRSAEAFNGAQASQVIKHQTEPMAVSASVSTTPIESIPVATRSSDVLHDDILFEIGRKGLTDDAKAALLRHAEFLKNEPDWGVLLQGYTDQQGSMSYNKNLGLKRAETVKQHLMALGVPETSIRTVSLGEEGAVCVDNSDMCQRMNRRVHLELRHVGREHLIIPVVSPTVPSPMNDDPQTVTNPDPLADEMQETGASLLESTTSQPELDAAPVMEEATVPSSPQ